MLRTTRVLLLLVGLGSFTAQAQNSSPPSVLRLNVGLGLSSLGALAGAASLNTGIGPVLVSLRTTANSESLRLFDESTEMFDVGLLAGWRFKDHNTYVSVAAGLGSVFGSHAVPGESVVDTKRERLGPVVGLPFEGQVFFAGDGAIGIGLYGYANLNRERSFGGVALCFRLGSLR